MPNTNIIDVLERIAQLSGTTGKVAYDSGTFADCIKNATDILGDVKEWNILQDVSGKTISIVGKNGQYVDFTGDSGLVHEFIAGNQLPTDAIYDAATKQLTVQTGNVLDEAGRITKKGLTIGASVGAQVVSGAVTALGGILTGVNWYENNPEFWTKVSQKLLPFAYDNPTEESWSDIFQEALFPTAVDGEGNRYIQADVIDAMRQVLLENGFYDTTTVITNNDSVFTDKMYEDLESYNFNYKTPIKTTKSVNRYRSPKSGGYYFYSDGSTSPAQYKDAEFLDTLNAENGFFINVYYQNKVPSLAYDGLLLQRGLLIGVSSTHTNFFASQHTVQSIYVKNTGDKPKTFYTYDFNSPIPSLDTYNALKEQAASNKKQYYSYFFKAIPYTDTMPLIENPNIITVATYLFYADQSESRLDNTQLIPEANYPQPDQSLKDNYPDWYDKVIQTVNPDWNPDQPESDDNKKYVDWLPLEIPDFTDNNANQGNSVPDAKQPDAQEGKPRPDDRVDETTNKAIDDEILPDPYPGVQPEPGPGGDSGETPDPPDPEDPDKPDPDPDIPVISGGSANALWKIYNPTLAELRQFGSWLWSDSWVDMVKQLFANNPAEGIIGLHMIYATPITGGSANIVVGYLDSGVSSKFVSQQYVNVDCGTVNIPLLYNSALDFGYTKVYCYLPFIGIVALDSYDVVGKTVRIMYTVDVLTGTVLAQIGVSLGNYSAVLYTFNGSCSVEYPLTSGSRAQQMLSLITGAVSGGAIGGIGGAIVGAARGAAVGADVRMSGNLAGNAGAMGIRKPYIIVKRPIETPALGYNEFYGYPANATYTLGSLAGYVRVKAVHVDSIRNATNAEKNEIENLLKTGVIIQ